VDIHAAARLGMLDRVRELIAADRESVHARGGDGQTPLHFASTVDIAAYLLDQGAEIDARDVDHELRNEAPKPNAKYYAGRE
jgi:hypothetical protein